MKRTIPTALAALAIAAASLGSMIRLDASPENVGETPVMPTPPAAPLMPMTNHVSVTLRPGAELSAVAQRNEALRHARNGAVGNGGIFYYADAASAAEAATMLRSDPDVLSAEHERSVRRVRKTNDTYYGDQWHLANTGQVTGGVGPDLNVNPAWNTGYTGQGVSVAVVDDGVEGNHPDLSANFDAAKSYDYEGGVPGSGPGLGDNHGTACAGLIGAVANNNLGMAGVAYQSNIIGIRLLGPNQSNATENAALAQGVTNGETHIFSNSWGPADGFGVYEAATSGAASAIVSGAALGRGGKGSIYVWAAGNGGDAALNGGPVDNSNEDGYANMPETIAVAAVDADGTKAAYSEVGANIVCSGMAGDSNVRTLDLIGANGYNTGSAPDYADGNYTNTFSGTSAATPMVSGVIALMLQANPNLTWRDVQHILVRTCRKVSVTDPGWFTNLAGWSFNSKFGAGLVDAGAATGLALGWPGVPARVSSPQAPDVANTTITDNTSTGITRTVSVPATSTLFCEHVQVQLVLSHPNWEELDITLTAPTGTVSTLNSAHISAGPAGPTGNTWTFMTVQHWGEDARGQWRLNVADRSAGNTGTLAQWQLIVHGTTSQVGSTGGLLPTITSMSPNPVKAGVQLTVSGTNLLALPASATIITVGGIPHSFVAAQSTASSVVIQLTATTPTGAQTVSINNGVGVATRNVTISNANGSSGNPGAALNGAYITAGGNSGNCAMLAPSGSGIWAFAVLASLVAMLGWFAARRRAE